MSLLLAAGQARAEEAKEVALPGWPKSVELRETAERETCHGVASCRSGLG